MGTEGGEEERRTQPNDTAILHLFISSWLPSPQTSLLHMGSASAEVRQVKGSRLTLSSRLVGLLDGLDDTDGNSLPHVAHGETTKGWVLVVALNTHGLLVLRN